MSDATMLVKVDEAIEAILGGAQHFAIGDKQVTRADLEILIKWKDRLELKIERAGRGPRITGVTPSHG